MTQIEVKQFAALSTKELFEIYKLRVAVFVVEQNVTTKKLTMTT